MSQPPRPGDLVEARHARLQSESLKHALAVQSEILGSAGQFLRERGFIEVLPVLLSPVTDPLRHATGKAEVEYYEHRYQLTRSMIFQKQMILLAHDMIFAFSPNIRLEPVELADTGRHLVEFTQLDLEMKGATREDVMSLAEDLIIRVLSDVTQRCAKALAFFGRELRVPRKPFARVLHGEVYRQFGGSYEEIISAQHREPVWVIDIAREAREFYDREDPRRPGTLVDMDLLYPEAFGEALSGGEREHEYDRIVARIEASGLNRQDFQLYLEFAKKGLPPSAGFGIGMERMTRFVCGQKNIADVVHFPKTPGTLSL